MVSGDYCFHNFNGDATTHSKWLMCRDRYTISAYLGFTMWCKGTHSQGKFCTQQWRRWFAVCRRSHRSHLRFPDKFKHASVTPPLKGRSLDGSVSSNYRLISNRNFMISKVSERLFLSRFCLTLWTLWRRVLARGHSGMMLYCPRRLRVNDDDVHVKKQTTIWTSFKYNIALSASV